MRARSGFGLSGPHHIVSVLPQIRRPNGKVSHQLNLYPFALLLAIGVWLTAVSSGLAQADLGGSLNLIAPPPTPVQATRSSGSLKADPDAGPLSGQGFLKIIRLGPSGALSLRAGPGTEHERLTVLPGDAVGLRPLDAFGRWTRVQYCGFEGWVAASFTAPMQDSESPLHECSRVGVQGISADPAAVGNSTRLALAPLASGLTAGLGQGFSEGELTQIARDDFDLPIRETATGRRLGQAPSKDAYLDCILEAEQERENEIVCVQAALRSWQVAMSEALERHRQLARSSLRDLERNQSAWRSYAQGTCDDFALADAPPVLKSHRATCQLMFTRERTLELEQLLVQRDVDCRLCKREAVVAEADGAAEADASNAQDPDESQAQTLNQDQAQTSN